MQMLRFVTCRRLVGSNQLDAAELKASPADTDAPAFMRDAGSPTFEEQSSSSPVHIEGMGQTYKAFCIASVSLPPPVPFDFVLV